MPYVKSIGPDKPAHLSNLIRSSQFVACSAVFPICGILMVLSHQIFIMFLFVFIDICIFLVSCCWHI